MEIADWHRIELGDRVNRLHYDRSDPNAHMRLYYYQNVLGSIIQYAEIRGITLFDSSSGMVEINGKQYKYNDILRNEYDKKYFTQQENKQFHMLFQLYPYLDLSNFLTIIIE